MRKGMRNTTLIIFWLLSAAATIRALILTDQEIQNIEHLFSIRYQGYNNPESCITEPLICKISERLIDDYLPRNQDYIYTQMTKSNEKLEQLYETLVSWKIKTDNQYKNTSSKILVLGNSGVGVSTFVQFLAGDNSKMISEEAGIGTEEYIIRDDDKIGSSLIESYTNSPEEVILLQNTSIIDLPGFTDSRNLTEEILVSTNIVNYFKNKFYDLNIKIVLLTEYYSVHLGIYKHNFINLLKNMYKNFYFTEYFIYNINLIVMKVPNKYKIIKTNQQLITNKIVITNIADFIKKVKISLKEKINGQNCYEKRFYSFAITIIEQILETDEDGNYRKINIFRQPDKPGPVSNITSLQENKKSLIETILSKPDDRIYLNRIAKKSSPILEKFVTCIKETADNNIRNTLEELKNIIPKYNFTDSKTDYSKSRNGCSYIDQTETNNEKIIKLNEQIKKMYNLKIYFLES